MTQPQLNLTTPVGQWVTRHPRTSRVFERLQIDYCCGGETPLEQACWDRELEPSAVLKQLDACLGDASGQAEPEQDWSAANLSDLCDHIEQTHHAYLRTELPRLTQQIARVAEAHGETHQELAGLQRVFASLRAELEPHMMKEEQILFPAIRQLERSAAAPAFPFGTVGNPIRMMEHEHDNAGAALGRIRALTMDFEVPTDACNTYRAMLDGLQQLEQDMHQHVHKENNILFPRALRQEQALAGSS